MFRHNGLMILLLQNDMSTVPKFHVWHWHFLALYTSFVFAIICYMRAWARTSWPLNSIQSIECGHIVATSKSGSTTERSFNSWTFSLDFIIIHLDLRALNFSVNRKSIHFSETHYSNSKFLSKHKSIFLFVYSRVA